MSKKIKNTKVKNVWVYIFLSISLITLIISTQILIKKGNSKKVRGIYNQEKIPIPIEAKKVSEDSPNNGEPKVVYTTKLSVNQIKKFYNNYAKLSGWKMQNQNSYKKQNKILRFYIENSNNKNTKETIVKVKIKNQ